MTDDELDVELARVFTPEEIGILRQEEFARIDEMRAAKGKPPLPNEHKERLLRAKLKAFKTITYALTGRKPAEVAYVFFGHKDINDYVNGLIADAGGSISLSEIRQCLLERFHFADYSVFTAEEVKRSEWPPHEFFRMESDQVLGL